MTIVLHASDILDFSTMPPPGITAEIQPKSSSYAPHYYHPSLGKINFTQLATPYMRVTDMRFELLEDFELRNVDSQDTVNINFFLKGSLNTSFSGLSHELIMRPDFHNIVYSPECKDVSRFHGAQTVEMLHISLQKDFFVSCLGNSDTWSERILEDLYHERPFSGNRINPKTTSYMARLIHAVRNNNEAGPMRNLLMQSRILELLALQMGQFRAPLTMQETIRRDEAEKLHKLKAYLDTNFLSDLSLNQLSRICLLNEFKVKKGFKLLFGYTVFNYLKKLRMEYASQLFADCSLSIEEVAGTLGYEHPQHFSVAFKKYTGVSPSVYQNKGK